MKTQIKHFYNTADFSQKEIYDLINTALLMKKGKYSQTLLGKTLIMLFFNPSLRTRVSFTVGMNKLGGSAIDYPVKGGSSYAFEYKEGVIMNQATMEHVKDATKVLSRYCNAIAIRAGELITPSAESVNVPSWQELKEDTVLKTFMKYSEVPVINMESNVFHPCQALGD